jgi:hypothetical protein
MATMADLDRKLRSLDEIPAPDLWARVGAPSGTPARPFPSPLRRVAIIAVALSLSVAAFVFAYVGLRNDRIGQPGNRTVSVASPVRHGELVCTATAPGVVHPGGPLGIAFTVENVGDRTNEISADGATSYVVTDPDGVVYDTTKRVYDFGPIVPPTQIDPGETWASGADQLLVRWGGPLTVTPTCLGTPLPALTLDVAVPGPTPTVADAIEGAAATNGDLLGSCMPVDDGVPTLGTIRPPTPADVPNMAASCSATVTMQNGFAVVRMLIVTPPEEQGVDVANPYYLIALPDDGRSIEVIVWDVVVTRDRATVVGGRAGARTEPSDGTSVSWVLTGTRWEGPTKAGSCGTQTTVSGPGFIEFINTCPSAGDVPFT